MCLCALMFINQKVVAAPGCRYQGRIYYNRTASPPNPMYEYYTNESWIEFSSATTCNAPGNESTIYVLNSETISRLPKGGFCLVYYGNTYLIGKGITFPETHQCPIDDYVPYLLFALLPLSFYFSRKRVLFSYFL